MRYIDDEEHSPIEFYYVQTSHSVNNSLIYTFLRFTVTHEAILNDTINQTRFLF